MLRTSCLRPGDRRWIIDLVADLSFTMDADSSDGGDGRRRILSMYTYTVFGGRRLTTVRLPALILPLWFFENSETP